MKKNHTKSGLIFSQLGLGAMNLPQTQVEADIILKSALENNITYIDTADLYQKGRNEETIGEFLNSNKLRHEVTLASKVGNEFNMINDEVKWNPSKSHIKRSITDSLARLKTDYLDLYMLHGGTIEDDKDEVIDTFESLKKEGLIRAYGISSIRPNVIDYYLEHSNIDTIMMQFSLIDNRPEQLVESIEKHDVRILARGPLMKGLLTDHASRILDTKFKDGILDSSYEELKQSINQAKHLGNLTELAYQYLLQYPVASIVNGASSKEQLLENIKHFENAMKQQASNIEQVRTFFKDVVYKDHIK
ncbi:aldo/keto reductase [Macrococcoides caseolyticum]|uniref:aldo/keto reductase n=1 Tax=Macrococcoides caseolyticum TaxID=69966 RepID=UPI001C600C44|nr:aldo/keto reductase [Macrococcus caseolyticus]MDJ1109667.1 aldo/keto reductase [Macrococcus caseolyticus]QYA40953.1 aldo/keto reductase [Macrococcus caseolyticus]